MQQIAANHKGIQLIHASEDTSSNRSREYLNSLLYPVVDDYGLETVQEYMYHIRNNAEMSVRNLLKDVAKRAGSNVLSAIDYLDDGSPVSIRMKDFSGNSRLSNPCADSTQGRDRCD